MKHYFLITFTSLFLLTCKDKKDAYYPSTDLELTAITVKKDINNRDSNIKLKGAIVALFDDTLIYRNAHNKFSTEGAIRIDTTGEDGTVLFTNINQDPSKTYCIASYYKDYNYYTDAESISRKISIMHDNDVSGYKIANHLNAKAFTQATVTLTPAESLVSFWASDTLKNRLPIKITINNDSVVTLTQQLSSAPTSYFSAFTETIKLRRGLNSYKATDVYKSCADIKNISITGGVLKNFAIDVNKCSNGLVSFWTGSENKDLNIDITINLNTKIGTLSNMFLTKAPTSCDTTNTIHYPLPPGKHNYIAIAAATGCAWTGTFTISETGGCAPENIIKLDKCNK